MASHIERRLRRTEALEGAFISREEPVVEEVTEAQEPSAEIVEKTSADSEESGSTEE